MQDFIVTKRAANGEREEVQYTAADRAALFSQLKAEGVNAISIREGKLDPRKARKPSRKPAAAPSKPRSPMRGLLAGLIVIVGAAAIYYFFLMPKPQQVESVRDKKPELIKEVAPAVVTNVAEVVTNAPAKPKEIRWCEGLKNAAIDDEGRVYFVPRPGHKLVTNNVNRINPAYHIFKRGYQNELASYLTAPPGTMFMGEMHYSDRFVKEVVETMSLPIEDDENDTPEQRELRQNMREVMQVIQDEVNAGRDVRELFQQAREEMQQLGQYRQTLEMEIRKMYHDSNMSDQDVNDAIDAANIMLEKKGIAPMQFGKVAKELIKNGRDLSGSDNNGAKSKGSSAEVKSENKTENKD